MWNEFKAFLIKQNAIALAIAVVIGTALSDVVKGIVDDVIMPIVAVALPNGTWRTATIDVGPFKFGAGDLVSRLVNFLIIGFVVWRLSKLFFKPKADVPTKACVFCAKGDLDVKATRCPHCTSALPAA